MINLKKVVRTFPNVQLILEEDKFTIKKDKEEDYWNLSDHLFCSIAASIFGRAFYSMWEEMKHCEKH